MNAWTKAYFDLVKERLDECEECGAPEGEEYLELMEAVAKEATERAKTYRETLAAKEETPVCGAW